MPHRQLTVALVVMLSLWTISRTRAKRLVRTALTRLNMFVLRCTSRRYRTEEGLTVVFAPHQDDETLGCGALIARKRYEGWPVHVVFLTDGGGSHLNHPQLTVSEVIAWRRREAAAALAELGVESCAVHFMDEPDGTLLRLTPARAGALTERIAVLLAQLRPAKIFLPCFPDGSSEHDAAYSLIMNALRQARQQPAVWHYAIWSWWNPLLQLRHIFLNPGRCYMPNEDFVDSKRAAIACYVSQTKPTPPWKEPVIPPDMLATLQADTEYFFRGQPPDLVP
ncbi:MAG: PIG-L family deacetylase [Lacunisphaera sp.]|nr:PIG-L family deacetylase [Lacunisphaera sp.]